MDIRKATKQQFFDHFKTADKSTLWSTATQLEAALKQLSEANTKLKLIGQGESEAALDLTDEELRARVRRLLIARLDDQSLTASEIGQFTKIFGLDQDAERTIIEPINYCDICAECPAMQPPTLPTIEADD